MSGDAPGLTALAVDSLGGGDTRLNPLRAAAPSGEWSGERKGQAYEYWPRGKRGGAPAWRFEFATTTIQLTASFARDAPPPAITLDVDPDVVHVTLLGRFDDHGDVRLPALLHVPDHGTFRVSASVPDVALGYASARRDGAFVRVTFPGATAERPTLRYTLEVVNVAPAAIPTDDRRFDGARRNWLNAFQLNPNVRGLANHAGSDPVAFVLYQYSEVALQTPPLADGLSALDLVAQSLDRYIDGDVGYGLTGYRSYDGQTPWTSPYDALDSWPSLLIAAANYVEGSNDSAWLTARYPTLVQWADRMLALDTNHDGLIEYPLTGDTGSWSAAAMLRPANWWDDVGFGHEDAYANALAYRALVRVAALADRVAATADAARFRAAAAALRAAYYATFYDAATGLLAGWRSRDGVLHDYGFTFVNAVAVSYGLLTSDQARAVMQRLWTRIGEVGYTSFQLGLPGNLDPIAPGDYTTADARFGADSFQVYENGGATPCFTYFTLRALYAVGLRDEADRLLFAMLQTFTAGGFQGSDANGMSYDWRAWDGTAHGYEGFLADCYVALLGVLLR